MDVELRGNKVIIAHAMINPVAQGSSLGCLLPSIKLHPTQPAGAPQMPPVMTPSHNRSTTQDFSLQWYSRTLLGCKLSYITLNQHFLPLVTKKNHNLSFLLFLDRAMQHGEF